jgi:hypothetical protein
LKAFYQDAFLIVLLLAVGPSTLVGGHFFEQNSQNLQNHTACWSRIHRISRIIPRVGAGFTELAESHRVLNSKIDAGDFGGQHPFWKF